VRAEVQVNIQDQLEGMTNSRAEADSHEPERELTSSGTAVHQCKQLMPTVTIRRCSGTCDVQTSEDMQLDCHKRAVVDVWC
jgi:hypothetical protein